MKIFFILLINVLFLTSCKNDCPVKVVEDPKETLRQINIKHNLQESNFMTDADTLKIEILDTNLFGQNPFKEILILIEANLSSSASGSNNNAYELINSDLRFEVNPNNEFEMWIMGFIPNLDSTRTLGVSRFLYYNLSIDFEMVNEYYKDSYLTFFVESTTE